MEDQKYRARVGQLFVDNFGRLNMTVQTGSEVAVAGTWTQGPQTFDMKVKPWCSSRSCWYD